MPAKSKAHIKSKLGIKINLNFEIVHSKIQNKVLLTLEDCLLGPVQTSNFTCAEPNY